MMFEFVMAPLVIAGFALFGYGMYCAGRRDQGANCQMAARVKILEEMIQEREQWIRELDQKLRKLNQEVSREREAHQRTRRDNDAVLRGLGIPEGTVVTLNYRKQPT